MIATLDGATLDASECSLLGRLPLDTIAEIELTMRRAEQARDIEQRA